MSEAKYISLEIGPDPYDPMPFWFMELLGMGGEYLDNIIELVPENVPIFQKHVIRKRGCDAPKNSRTWVSGLENAKLESIYGRTYLNLRSCGFDKVNGSDGKEKPKDEDPVDHPNHYSRLDPEPIEVIANWGLNFNLGNIVKYAARCGLKDSAVDDLKKIRYYAQKEIDRYEKKRK